ncbi:TetR/AcrR family transcriptional regulator C-terminal domain-containing protein [Nonomuraea glycinis]|uniref:Tetracycline repressor TetR C-terminal domain-containing protein n=1 Tax=Nonomuraea glycinis TaxID=2047744 RepID=A0A918A0T6_9ACTN|nr:TetR/AcrR family transcriptional regulator C-terminal domain-containing protein [Nonomuraea glycinis]MCA2176786.1 TetR/AcrR family transcriptional regulator C-terminal domain-containing protein [Nonomuraea glycinis]GGP03313.1 hypothetical protein GCM10012278_14030 [Nonomuraea glycinis]
MPQTPSRHEPVTGRPSSWSAARLTAAVSGGRYPRLGARSVAGFLDFDARFAFGLRVLLAGLKAECSPRV